MSLFEPVLNHRFQAFFMLGYFPDVLSTRFERISGLTRQIEVQSFREGGNNIGSRYLPQGVSFGNLTFERGVMTVSPLTGVFDYIISGFKTSVLSLSVDIMLMSSRGLPMATWSVSQALPVRVSIGDFDANSGNVLIDSMEITCQRIEWLGVKL
ncbi:phage tail protein [Xenorhabdus szentirmaii]|uniref:phage tail protein n=1 Tax=Xenorhabdus szentirmaii TaxID=290112 RepID=UPI0032B7A1DD